MISRWEGETGRTMAAMTGKKALDFNQEKKKDLNQSKEPCRTSTSRLHSFQVHECTVAWITCVQAEATLHEGNKFHLGDRYL
jgi:hypothetical protein